MGPARDRTTAVSAITKVVVSVLAWVCLRSDTTENMCNVAFNFDSIQEETYPIIHETETDSVGDDDIPLLESDSGSEDELNIFEQIDLDVILLHIRVELGQLFVSQWKTALLNNKAPNGAAKERKVATKLCLVYRQSNSLVKIAYAPLM